MRFASLIACVFALTLAHRAAAATFSLEPVLAGAFDSSFLALPLTTVPTPADPVTYQYDLLVHISNLGPGEAGLGALRFDIELVDLDPVFGFQPNIISLDSNGAAPGGSPVPIFQPAVVLPPGDGYHNILVMISPFSVAPADPRRVVGQLGGVTLIGSFFASADVPFVHPFTLDDIEFRPFDFSSQLMPAVSAPDLQVILFPEPGSLLLATIPAAAWLSLRRRSSTS